jgi:hypothetical protein
MHSEVQTVLTVAILNTIESRLQINMHGLAQVLSNEAICKVCMGDHP